MDKKQVKGDLSKLQSVEKGMYLEAAKKGVPFSTWLEDHITTNEGGGFEPSIYKGLCRSEVYKLQKKRHIAGEERIPTAFELALAANNIKAFGAITDRVGKFFVNSATSSLFPEFMANRIYTGAVVASIWDKFVDGVTVITGLDYKKIYLNDTEGERQMGRASRGSELPIKHFSVGDESVHLEKYGLQLLFDYEVLEDQPLDLYGKELEKVGKQVGVDETNDMLYTLVNGDGNSNGLESDQTVTTTTTTEIGKIDIIGLATACPMPYQLTAFVGTTAYMRKYWDALSDMTNPSAQKQEIGVPLPQGYRWDSGQMLSVTDRLYGVDASQAMSYITNDNFAMTETDRLIDKQQVRTVITKRGVFTVNTQDAIGALDIEH